MLELSGNELHLVSVVNHRLLNASIYGSVAVLKSARPSLSKTHMSIRATSLGVTSFDFPKDPFVTWAFTRTSAICEQLGEAVAGCSVVEDDHVERAGYLTYCERVYLNPITGTGPESRPWFRHKVVFFLHSFYVPSFDVFFSACLLLAPRTGRT